MAKRKSAIVEVEVTEVEITEPLTPRDDAPDFFVNSAGGKVFCRPLPFDYLAKLEQRIEKAYRDQGEPLDPPTYSFEAEGGNVITLPHDETTLRTDEEKGDWAAHIDALNRMGQEKLDKMLKGLCLHGVDFSKGDTPSKFTQWQEVESFMGTLPETELERKFEFARFALVVSIGDAVDEQGEFVSDMMKCLQTCTLLGFSGATAQQVAQAKSLFRGAVGGTRAETDSSGSATDQDEQ